MRDRFSRREFLDGGRECQLVMRVGGFALDRQAMGLQALVQPALLPERATQAAIDLGGITTGRKSTAQFRFGGFELAGVQRRESLAYRAFAGFTRPERAEQPFQHAIALLDAEVIPA